MKSENEISRSKNLTEFKSPTISVYNFEVRHLRCVGSIAKNFCVLHNEVEHNYILSSITLGLQLHVINSLAQELFFLILAHSVYKV